MLTAMHWFLDFLLHLDKHLALIVQQYGNLTYWILFAILFAETGLVMMPFLPGDSLLFTVGTLAGSGTLRLEWAFPLLLLAVVLGDNVNYWIGRLVGPKLFGGTRSKLLNRRHLERTHAFFEKYGPRAIIYARFVPIVRTFMPFVAGLGSMSYPRFLAFSVCGCLLWFSLAMLGGYYFGTLQVVRHNFSLVIGAIIVISLMPPVLEVLKARREARA